MIAKLMLDKAGRINLPKRLRDDLALGAGDIVEVECTGEEIRLTPLRGQRSLRKKRGVWASRTGEPLTQETVEKAIRALWRERTITQLSPAKPAKQRGRPDFITRLKKIYRAKSLKVSGAELVSTDRSRT
jgi:AbrB family looped-hinge helix DNA binding protein